MLEKRHLGKVISTVSLFTAPCMGADTRGRALLAQRAMQGQTDVQRHIKCGERLGFRRCVDHGPVLGASCCDRTCPFGEAVKDGSDAAGRVVVRIQGRVRAEPDLL